MGKFNEPKTYHEGRLVFSPLGVSLSQQYSMHAFFSRRVFLGFDLTINDFKVGSWFFEVICGAAGFGWLAILDDDAIMLHSLGWCMQCIGL